MITSAAPPVDGATGVVVGVEVGHCNWPSLICVQGEMVLEVLRVVYGGGVEDTGLGGGIELLVVQGVVVEEFE